MSMNDVTEKDLLHLVDSLLSRFYGFLSDEDELTLRCLVDETDCRTAEEMGLSRKPVTDPYTLDAL